MKNHFYRSGRNVLAGGLAAGLCLTGAAFAQTVTVDASLGSPNNSTEFNTLHEAVASFATGGVNAGNAADNIININPATPVVDEVNADMEFTTPMVIEGGMTIQGDGGLAVLAGTPLDNNEQILRVTNSATSPPVLPCFAWRQAGELTIKNVAFIPTDPTMCGLVIVKAPTSSDDSVINFENCVFTANDGTNHPIVTTGKEPAPDLTAPGVISLADKGDALWAFSRIEQGDLTLNLTKTVFASYGVTADNTGDAIIAYMNGATSDLINCTVNVNEGCVFANITGRAIQNPYGGYVNVNGTEANPVVFHDIQASAVIWNFTDTSQTPSQPTACKVNYARFYNVSFNAISEALSRAFIDSVTNTVIADAGSDGINLIASGDLPPGGFATDTVTVDHVTIHNAGSGGSPGCIYAGTTNRNLVVSNCVMTGNGKNGVVYNGTATCTISDSILSLNGDNALMAQTAGTGNIVIEPSVTDQAVTYVNMDDPFSPDFFKVVGSNVQDWSVY